MHPGGFDSFQQPVFMLRIIKNVKNRNMSYTYKCSALFHAFEAASDRGRRYHDIVLIPDEIDHFVDVCNSSVVKKLAQFFAILASSKRAYGNPLLPPFHV